MIDQSPIGKSPRSNPTYVKAFDDIRTIFADTPLARQRKYTPGTFSFNVEGGRCEACEGAGALEVEMVFMADVYVPCDDCGGKRYKPEVLDVRARERTSTRSEPHRRPGDPFFPREEKLGQGLAAKQVGWLASRGQRRYDLGWRGAAHKIAASSRCRQSREEDVRDGTSETGPFEDIRKLAKVFDRLLEQGHTLVLIEHNLDVIKLADWIIDLGPEGGIGGGQVVVMGRPEDVARVEESHTGRWLAPLLERRVDRAEISPRLGLGLAEVEPMSRQLAL